MADNDNNNHHRRNRGETLIAGAALGVVTVNSGVAIYRARGNGDAASAVFVAASYLLLLLLLFACLRAYERAAPGSPARERPRRAVWAVTALLTLAFAWKAGVWAAAAATSAGSFVLLFRQQRRLRELEQGGTGDDAKIKEAVSWALITTLLITALFGSYASGVAVAPLDVVVVGALVFPCLAEFERAQIDLGGQYADLVKLGFGVAACDSALAASHRAHGDAASLALVFVAYAGFVSLSWLFLRRFAGRARGAGQ